MKVTSKVKKKAKAAVITYLNSVSGATRTQLIDGALSLYGFSASELEDRSPKSKSSTVRSYLGTAINDLVTHHDIKLTGDTYSLAKEEIVIIHGQRCEEEIRKLLSTARAYTKNDIFYALEKRFGTDLTPSPKDDITLREIASGVLFELLQNDEIEFIDGKYRDITPASQEEIIDTPLGEKEFKAVFFKKMWLMGGKFFEGFCAALLEKYFTMTDKLVIYCDVTGGSDDGGIDIVIETLDSLGFSERILAQTKCRDRAFVTEKEVREFYGAMNLQNGTRGMYITTTFFHDAALDVIDASRDLVGIDADKLFELVKKTQYGIKRVKDGYVIDNAIFVR